MTKPADTATVPSVNDVIAFIRDPRNVQFVRSQLPQETSKPATETLQIEIPDFESIEDTEELRKAMKAFAGKVQKAIANERTRVQGMVQEVEQRSTHKTLQSQVTALKKSNKLFREMMDENKHPELMKDTNNFLNAGEPLEQAFAKAMRANEISEEPAKPATPAVKPAKPAETSLSTDENVDVHEMKKASPESTRESAAKALDDFIAEHGDDVLKEE